MSFLVCFLFFGVVTWEKKEKSRRERLFLDARPFFRILNSLGKMMTSYPRDTN